MKHHGLILPPLLGLILLGWSLSVAAEGPHFSPTATLACVTEADANTPGRTGHAVLDCVGRSAQACMMTPGGDSTLGMMECLDAELAYWNDRLAVALADRQQAARANDADVFSLRSTPASVAAALDEMQSAWIAYRNAACLYEQTQWLGGTGGGPATLACHLHETARQALKLDGWWAQ